MARTDQQAREQFFAALDMTLHAAATFLEWLNERAEAENTWNCVAANIQTHMQRFHDSISQIKSSMSWPRPRSPLFSNWGPIKLARPTRQDLPLRLVISGPFAIDHFEFIAADDESANRVEEFVSYANKACSTFADLEKKLASMFDVYQTCEDQRSHLSQDPETTIRDHIRLLRDYNEMKDIGQKLIGVVADNRGILIGALYEDSQYGVTPHD